ncbi:hypothetical protein C8N24_1537 [Solirubrobacter pauli]|uniref:Uncharacterized protein n=1 Tax=Solirubrobacter pauli TaxID=166793 RepID=A0A660LAV2_9ACTN|nr:hypothetical protein [Solirubrobacter pauli]RKQ91709.1 hypothetical protein C8N24_1537 [Solirubrobacter pauli]
MAVPVLAVAFAACGSDDDSAYCVDQNDQIVENRYCDDEAYAGNGGGGGAFFWFYGGSPVSGSRYTTGTKLKGGDRVAASNVAENARRGGFGSSSRSTSASGVGRSVASHSGGG